MKPEYGRHEKRIFRELVAAGFQPAVIYDVGASTGEWSEAIASVLPDAEYHLFEPLASRVDLYRQELPAKLRSLRKATLHPVALGDENGSRDICVFSDGYSSSFLDPGPLPEIQDRVPVTTYRLDDFVLQKRLPAPDVIKIDCQGFEAAILRGAAETVGHAMVLVVEAWFTRGYGPKTPVLDEIVDWLRRYSFSLVELGEHRYDKMHRLMHVDAFFFSQSLLSRFSLPPKNASLEFSRKPVGQPTRVLYDADVIITHIEVNDKHGVGALTRRLFAGGRNVISLRSADYYGGEQQFGDLALRVEHKEDSRDADFMRVLTALGGSTVRRVLCIPFFADDVRTALAVKESYGVPMCTYLMDDQNICAGGIPDDLMRELLAKSALRLAISPEMRAIYEHKYALPVWYMPPVVAAPLIPSVTSVPHTPPDSKHGVIIGNIWGRRWLELLRQTVRGSGVTLSWYSIGGFGDLPCPVSALASDSIFPHDPLPDDDLVKMLRETWFAVLPSGPLDDTDDRRFLSQLSLPSRLVYLLATSHIPILVLGSSQTAAARFVRHFEVGLVADYDRDSFVDRVNYILRPDVNLAMRHRAVAVAGRFTDIGAAEWIWQSLERGEPIDSRFEDLAPSALPNMSPLLELQQCPPTAPTNETVAKHASSQPRSGPPVRGADAGDFKPRMPPARRDTTPATLPLRWQSSILRKVSSSRDWIMAILVLVLTIWVAHFSQSFHLGLYEDDWSFIGQPMGWTGQKTLDTVLLYLRQWPQGRPVGYSALTALSFLGNWIGGLEGIFLLAFVLKVVNTLIFYTIARRRLSPAASLCGALAFCLFPSDTSTPLLTNALFGGITLFFLLAATWLYLTDRKLAAYIVSAGSLLTYESAFLPFFAVPILRTKPLSTLRRELLRHWAILLTIGGSLFYYRLQMVEEKTADVVRDGILGTMLKMVTAFRVGPLTTLRLFLTRPVTLWREGNGEDLLVVVLMAVGLSAALYFLLRTRRSDRPAPPQVSFPVRWIRSRVWLTLDEPLAGALRTGGAGAVMLVFAYGLAISRWYYPPVVEAGRLTFTHLAAAVGSGLLCGALSSLLFRVGEKYHKRVWAVAALASYFAVLAGFHYRVQRDFRKSWEVQRHFWYSVLVKCPDITDGTLILYEDEYYPFRYVLVNSWADPLVLGEIFTFPKNWKQPPQLFSVPRTWPDDVTPREGELFWKPPPPWAPNRTLPQRNVILLKGEPGSNLSRVTGSLTLKSAELLLKSPRPPAPVSFPHGPLYHLVLGR